MSFDILQQPTTPNVVGTPLVYSMSSSNAGQPQFRYVLTLDIVIFDPTNENVELKVYPNKDGIGIIDLSNILNTYAESYLNADLTTYGLGGITSVDIYYGEEYAPDFNSIPTYYPIDVLPRLQVLGGYKNINDDTGTGYNFDSGSYMIESGSGDFKKLLTNDPSIVKFFQPAPIEKQYVPRNGGSVLGGIYALAGPNVDMEFQIVGFDSNNNFISLDSIAFSGTGASPSFFTANTTPDFPGQYANLIANWNNIAYYDFVFIGTDEYMRHYVLDDCDISDITSFAWINEFGVYDHYTVYNPRRRKTDISRNNYDRTFVRYEDSNSSYNINNRGKRQYLTEYDYTYSVTTDFLTESQAKWLSGMIESNDVFVASFIPQSTVYKDILGVKIVNTSYEVNNSTSRNKLFQYTIDFKFNTQYQDR